MLHKKIKSAAIQYVKENFDISQPNRYPVIVGYWITLADEHQITHSVQIELNDDEFVTISVRSRLEIIQSSVVQELELIS